MDAHEFIRKWRDVDLTERSASQQHFLDRIVVHTNFTSTPTEVHEIPLARLSDPRSAPMPIHA